MIELSIVSGTYNRLPHLKNMVYSVRHSVGVGIPYEIVLVDGGSVDGTIAWCKQQSDIRLIEQGRLVGAVKAFNAGFAAAKGRYVVPANDDISFVEDSLLCALSFMHDHSEIGVGCFWQDRGGKGWHLEYQPAILDGKQMSHIYGQVCIVPRWLGELAGWWGDYTYTYGGDNHLSSAVMELGYLVRAVPHACIHDAQVEDELREVNNAAYKDPDHAAKSGRPNTDSVTWGLMWTHKDGPYKGMCGPIIQPSPIVSSPMSSPLRIFYAPIYEPGRDIQKISKRGLRDALAEVGLVMEYDYMGASNGLGREQCLQRGFEVATAWNPHLFVFQLQGTGEYTAEEIAGLRVAFPNAIFVNWNGDYHPDALYNPEYMSLLSQFDVTGLVTTSVAEHYAIHGIQWFYWQIGYEESNAEPTPDTPRHDIVFLANGYSDARQRFVEFLYGLGVDVGLYGAWPEKYNPRGDTLYDFDAGQKLYRAAKLTVSDDQWGATGFVSNRLFQAMAAGGAMMLQRRFPGIRELLGIVDGEHLVLWDNFVDLEDKIRYYLSHEEERRAIADSGTACVLEDHSFDVRVMELVNELRIRGLWPISVSP